MRDISPENLLALQQKALVPRDFLWFETLDGQSVGFWSDLANITALVTDPDSEVPVLRPWVGAGNLISISDIPATAQISVEKITIDMSQLAAQIEMVLRSYHVKQARVEIFRGLLDPISGQLVSPAMPRFVGYIDHVELVTPSEGREGVARITVASHAQELLRSNPATRSHEDQLLRSPGDTFFKDAAVVGDWGPFQWGPKEVAQNTQKKGLFGWGGFLGFL